MSEMREEKPVVGRLFTGGREYELLALEPNPLALPVYGQYGALSFYVRNAFGYAVHVAVKGEFIVEPAPVAKWKDVIYIVEEVEEIKVQNTVGTLFEN